MTYRVRAVDDLHNVLDMNVVLFRVQGQGGAVVLPAVDRLVAHRQHLPVHVQHLQDTPAFTVRQHFFNISNSIRPVETSATPTLRR